MSSRALALLAAHAGRPSAAPGDRLAVQPDHVLLDDVAAHEMQRRHHNLDRSRTRVARGRRCRLVDTGALDATTRRKLLKYTRDKGIDEPGQALDPARRGWPGTVATEEGWVGSGDVVVGATPDVGGVGGLGALALRAGPDELAALLAEPALAIHAPQVLRAAVHGRLPRWLGAVDLALHLAEQLGESARGAVLELEGDAVTGLSVDARIALCEALARSGLVSLVAPDEATRVWLAARRAGDPEDLPGGPGQPAPDAEQPLALELKGRRLGLRAQHEGRLLDPAAKDGPRVDEVVLSGALDDLRQAGWALSERRLQPGLRLHLVPASRRTLQHALDEGLVSAFVRAGAVLHAPATVLPPPARGETRLTTRPTAATDLLANPAVAVASAVCGRLVDPESMRREQRPVASLS